ncbi:hypothetical protein AGRA3207_007522 [Actinomadura graeca]|uniref:Uncharacterized protein n=1 Tax=Actinomadura graeca TaxID=2750812 RepID=A0ABX8R533_9ACTN|nr:hypothetical protein [Actinomadura graeca]QXJ25953.1 hypothetical protein AGRA3207_007522 [Actinomadura graeca]
MKQRITQLPGTADAIADHLHHHNITGTRGSARDCPLSRYFADGAPPGSVICVDTDPAEVQIKEGERNGMKIDTLPLPPPVAEFIHRFDHGQYGWLKDPGTGHRPQEPGDAVALLIGTNDTSTEDAPEAGTREDIEDDVECDG